MYRNTDRSFVKVINLTVGKKINVIPTVRNLLFSLPLVINERRAIYNDVLIKVITRDLKTS
jgi:hypothetical protein